MPLTSEVLDKFSELITTALGLVAALAWNTAIQNLFDTGFGGSGSKLTGQFVYATLTTFVIIFAAIAVSRAAQRAKKAEERHTGLFGRSSDYSLSRKGGPFSSRTALGASAATSDT
jgi:hypothetical protein